MEKVCGVGREERNDSIGDLACVGGPGARTGRESVPVAPWHYPMKADNPYLLMTDEEFKPVIREAYKAFEQTLERLRQERLARIATQEKPKQ